MFAIIYIYVMLFSFVTIIISSLGFLVYIDWRNKRFHKRVNKIHADFAEVIKSGFSTLLNGQAVDELHIEYVQSKLKQRAYEKVFEDVIVELANDSDLQIYVPIYINLYENYLLQLVKRIKPNASVRHIQTIFMLGEYRYNHPDIIAYLLEGVRSLSITSRFNSMSAISKIGNAEALVQSLIFASGQRRYMNMKVLTDILDNFEGNKERLNKRLVKSFMQFNHELKLLVINYFYNEGSKIPIEVLDQYLESVTDKEEHIQLLKYFGAIQHPPVLVRIENSLKSTYWEVRAIAAKALINYVDYFDLDHIKESLGDANWYVRTNTAKAVLEHLYSHLKLSEEEISEFINGFEDKYAIGAMEYAKDIRANTGS